MNLFILLAILAMAVSNFEGFIGMVVGLTYCYFFMDGKGENSTIRWHLTRWSWWDIRV